MKLFLFQDLNAYLEILASAVIILFIVMVTIMAEKNIYLIPMIFFGFAVGLSFAINPDCANIDAMTLIVKVNLVFSDLLLIIVTIADDFPLINEIYDDKKKTALTTSAYGLMFALLMVASFGIGHTVSFASIYSANVVLDNWDWLMFTYSFIIPTVVIVGVVIGIWLLARKSRGWDLLAYIFKKDPYNFTMFKAGW